MEGFFHDHPILGCVLVALVLMLSGLLDHVARARMVAYVNWWLGGVLAVGAISCGIAIDGEFLGLFRWPATAIVFILGLWSVFWGFKRLRASSDRRP